MLTFSVLSFFFAIFTTSIIGKEDKVMFEIITAFLTAATITLLLYIIEELNVEEP